MTFSAIARDLILCDLHAQEDRDETRAAQGESRTAEGMSGRMNYKLWFVLRVGVFRVTSDNSLEKSGAPKEGILELF